MSNGYKKGPYSPIQWALSSTVIFLAPSLHKILCNPAGPRQFCALPSECLALWQHQHLNTSVRHTSCSAHAWCQHVLPLLIAMHHICLFSWYYTYCNTPSPTGSGFFTGATHITHKNQNTLHTSKSAMVPADHPSSVWHSYGIHS